MFRPSGQRYTDDTASPCIDNPADTPALTLPARLPHSSACSSTLSRRLLSAFRRIPIPPQPLHQHLQIRSHVLLHRPINHHIRAHRLGQLARNDPEVLVSQHLRRAIVRRKPRRRRPALPPTVRGPRHAGAPRISPSRGSNQAGDDLRWLDGAKRHVRSRLRL